MRHVEFGADRADHDVATRNHGYHTESFAPSCSTTMREATGVDGLVLYFGMNSLVSQFDEAKLNYMRHK